MNLGFEFVAAKPKGKASEADAPMQQSMRPAGIRTAPSTDQKKVRRAMSRGVKKTADREYPNRTAQKEPVMSRDREVQILRAMAVARPEEQARLALDLENLRASRVASRRQEESVDLSRAVVAAHLTPVAVHEVNTSGTDWLSTVASGPGVDPSREMKTEASLWFSRLSPEVKADREEFVIQAQGAARRVAGKHGEQMAVASRAFLDHVAHLHRAAVKEARVRWTEDRPGREHGNTGSWNLSAKKDLDGTYSFFAQYRFFSGKDNPGMGDGFSSMEEAKAAAEAFAEANPAGLKEAARTANDQNGLGESTVTDYDSQVDQEPWLAEDWDGSEADGVHPPMPGAGGQQPTARHAAKITNVSTTTDTYGKFHVEVTISGTGDDASAQQAARDAVPDQVSGLDLEQRVSNGGDITYYFVESGSRSAARKKDPEDEDDPFAGKPFGEEQSIVDYQETKYDFTDEGDLQDRWYDGDYNASKRTAAETYWVEVPDPDDIMGMPAYSGSVEDAPTFLVDGTYPALDVNNDNAPVTLVVENGRAHLASRRTAAEGQTCAVCGDKIAKDPSGEDNSTWHHDNGEKHDHEAKPSSSDSKESSRKTAISLTHVGIEGSDGVGTDPSGKRVKFRLSDQDLKDLKAVLYSDLAMNFSGVDIEESDIISTASRKQAADSYEPCPVHEGHSFDKSTGFCSCGSNHRAWASPNNPDGFTSSRRTASEPLVDPDKQDGDAESGLEQVEVGDENDRPMYPWEMDANTPGTGAADVASVPTPGGEAGYPKASAKEAGSVETQIKLLEQNISRLRAQMSSTVNKDEARRRLKAMQDRLADLTAQKSASLLPVTAAFAARVQASLAKQAMPNPVDLGVKVGDIFVSNWGYDQTNIDFYKVIGLTGASVKVVQVGKHMVGSHGTSDSVVPDPENEVGEVMTKRIQGGPDAGFSRPAFTVNSYAAAFLWDGKPQYQTASGYGH